MTHIEVTNDKGHCDFKSGQLLSVIRQTPAFIHVRSHAGTEYRISKKTQRIIGTMTGFIRTGRQPQTQF